VESLSDNQIDQIRKYVGGGGGLVATDDTSLYDQWRRMRQNYGLSDVLNVKIGERRAKPVKQNFGDGRSVYVPHVIPAVTPPKPGGQWYRWIGNEYWRLPQNWEELLEAVSWASETLSIEIEAPLTVTAQLWKKKDKQLLSLVNYRAKELVEDIQVRIKIPESMDVKKISLLSPDMKGVEDLTFKRTKNQTSFRIPKLLIYDLILIE